MVRGLSSLVGAGKKQWPPCTDAREIGVSMTEPLLPPPQPPKSSVEMLMHVVFKIIVPALEAAKVVKHEVFLERTTPRK